MVTCKSPALFRCDYLWFIVDAREMVASARNLCDGVKFDSVVARASRIEPVLPGRGHARLQAGEACGQNL